MQVKCTMITRLKPFSLNLNQMMMMSSTILSKDRAKVQNHLMLVFSRRKIACPFWLFLVIFVISLLDVSNFVSHDRDFFAPCRVAIVALPNATFDWLNLLSVIVASFYDWSDLMIFDPSWRCHVTIVEWFHLTLAVFSMLVCFYDMLTDFGDDFLNGSNYNFKNYEN